jgi:4-hydroxybenzoate polyprenyltransferase
MRTLQYLIYSNILVSLSAGSLAYACAVKLGNPHNVGIGLTVFFATLFIYNIQRILRLGEIKVKSSDRHYWLEKHTFLIKILAGIGIIGAVTIYFAVLGWDIDFWFLAFSAVIGVLYALKVHPKTKALRDIPHAKIYLIALQWALVSVYWPYMRVAHSIDFPIGLGLSIFFFILAATIPFDIRDLVYDAKHKSTIPQIFGVRGAKIIAILFLGLSALSLCYFFPIAIYSWWFYICYIVLVLLILNSCIKRHEMYYSVIIDGWIIVYALLVYFI